MYNWISQQEKGVEFVIEGTTKVMYGTVAIVSADNLGSLALGGFKESCSSLRMCRHCMATKEDSKNKVINAYHYHNIIVFSSFMNNISNFEIKQTILNTVI